MREQYFFLPATLLLTAYAYFTTLCPTVYVGDSGELTTAAYYLGIPHSPGYPLYCLIGWIFTHIPFSPDIAFRLNIMSAVFALATVLVLYLIIYHFTRTPYISFSVSLAYGFSPIFWSQALTAEVYSLNTFLTALSLYFLCRWLEKRADSWLYLAFFTMGIAVANHQLAFLLLPTGIYLLWLFGKGLKKTLRFWAVLGLLYATGLLFYLYLPIRAATDPPINWGDPDNLVHFVKAVFAPAGSQVSAGSRWQHFLHALYLWTVQFSPMIPSRQGDIPIPVIWLFGLWGIYKGLSTGWRMARVFVFFMLLNVAAIIFVSRPTSQEMMIVGVYYLPVFLVYAVFMATGIREWLQHFLTAFAERKRPILLALIILVLVLIPEYQFLQNRREVDRSRDYYARDYGTMLLTSCPANSILLVNWDDLFILWYLQKVENMRPDVIPVLADFPIDGKGSFWGKWIFDSLMAEYPEMFQGSGIGTTSFSKKEEAINAFVMTNLEQKRPVYFSFYGLNYDFLLLEAKVFPLGPVYRAGLAPYTVADLLVAKENWQKAIEKFRDLYSYSEYRDDEEDFIIARISTNLGNTGNVALNIDPAQATWFFEKAVQMNLGNIPALESLAAIYLKQQRYNELKALLLEADNVDPSNPEINWFLALLYDQLGEKELEIRSLQRVLDIDPNHPEARTQMERLRGAGK